MQKDDVLGEIFDNDPFGILEVKPRVSNVRSEDDRLVASFEEINNFVDEHNREPLPDSENMQEKSLYFRLKGMRCDEEKKLALESIDRHNLLIYTPKAINTIDDIFEDDFLGILRDDSEGLYDFKHTPEYTERASSEFVAKRKPCKNFDQYEALFKDVQKDLANGKRKLLRFKEDNLREGEFYVNNGVLFLLENINITQKEQTLEDGKRIRKDGRTRCIFENGTESNMLYRSVAKILYANGQIVSENFDKVNEGFLENFGCVTEEDKEAGYIYVLRSKSRDERIYSIGNLFKIGYSKTEVDERIKNAEKDPTYLMAPVEYVAGWKCFNMNPQKFEQLIHTFFGKSCLNIDVFDEKSRRHTPREWFIAPLEVVEQAIELIINGKIINYIYDPENESIRKR